jgi:hypothetical protein
MMTLRFVSGIALGSEIFGSLKTTAVEFSERESETETVRQNSETLGEFRYP